ncbi:MAG TPA: Hsp20/alpha crystallin family protein [Xanthobacteraceae bacterium]
MIEPATKVPIKTRRTPHSEGLRGSPPGERLRTEIDRLLDDFLRGYWHVPFRRSVVDVEPYWRGEVSFGATPAVDIVKTDSGYKLTAELPGLEPHHVSLTFADGTLTIEGDKQEPKEDAELDHFLAERRYGAFHRSFRVSDAVDADRIEASFANGVLTVALPKAAEARRKEKTIAVKTA